VKSLNLRQRRRGFGCKLQAAKAAAIAICKQQGLGNRIVRQIARYLHDLPVDIQMPKMNGLELLGYLRGIRPHLAVVMLTAR